MLQVLFEDNHLLVVSKPAGLATMGVAEGEASLLDESRRYIKEKYQKPGNVYLGVVSRLDAAATGVLVFARTSKAAARLSGQFRDGEVDKKYWAIVSPPPSPVSDRWLDFLIKDERQKRMVVAAGGRPGAQQARLRYWLRTRTHHLALLQIQLETGRKHQIRVQCAAHGSPIAGDRKYGSRLRFPHGIALHAHSLSFTHPTRSERLEFQAPLPQSWHLFAENAGLELYP